MILSTGGTCVAGGVHGWGMGACVAGGGGCVAGGGGGVDTMATVYGQ